MVCVLCGRRAKTVHADCVEALDNRLLSIPGLYAELAIALQPGRAGGEHVSGTPTPALPLRIEPLSLLCRGGIVTILATWETDWRERRGLSERPARAGREQLLDGGRVLVDVVDFLHTHLEWAARSHPAVDEFAGEIGDIISACRLALSARSDLRVIGQCPADLGDRTCGRVLIADPYAYVIRCDRCRTEWPRPRWPLLGAKIAEPAA